MSETRMEDRLQQMSVICDPYDSRDLPYGAQVGIELPRFWIPQAQARLESPDQGRDGSCCGQGARADAGPRIWLRDMRRVDLSARFAYEVSKEKYDPWSGRDYQGTTVRGVAMVLVHEGICEASVWPYHERDTTGLSQFTTAQQKLILENAALYRFERAYQINGIDYLLKHAIWNHGSFMCGMRVHSGWALQGSVEIGKSEIPIISYDPAIHLASGLHCIDICGWDDEERCYYAQNSWGGDYGKYGYFAITYRDFNINFMRNAWVVTFKGEGGIERRI